jgi:hypothetical protein
MEDDKKPNSQNQQGNQEQNRQSNQDVKPDPRLRVIVQKDPCPPSNRIECAKPDSRLRNVVVEKKKPDPRLRNITGYRRVSEKE